MQTETVAKVRASSLPLFWACPKSQERPEGVVLVNESNEAAEAGTAFHRWIAAHIAGDELDQAALAKEHGIEDEDELRMLCAQGARAYAELKKHFDGADAPPLTEVALETILDECAIVGTADMLARSRDVGLILDWKTGRVESDYTHQLRGYTLAAMELLGDVREMVVITVWVRQGVWDVERLSREQLTSWARHLNERARNGAATFNPGGHCQYCPRRMSCPARTGLVRATIAELTSGEPVIEWTPETRKELGPRIGELLDRADMVKGLCETFRAAVKADVQEHGPIPIGDGRQLGLQTVRRRSLDTRLALPVLKERLGADELRDVIKISVSDCESAVAARAPKGKGAASKRELCEALEQAGAIRTTETFQLREQKERAE